MWLCCFSQPSAEGYRASLPCYMCRKHTTLWLFLSYTCLQQFLIGAVVDCLSYTSFTVKKHSSISISATKWSVKLDLGPVDKNMGCGFKRGVHCRICKFRSGWRWFASGILDASKQRSPFKGCTEMLACNDITVLFSFNDEQKREQKQLSKPVHGHRTDSGKHCIHLKISENDVIFPDKEYSVCFSSCCKPP